MHFRKGDDFLDMESFEFCMVCARLQIKDYACVRICSDVPEATKDVVEGFADYLPDAWKTFAKEWPWSVNIHNEQKQIKIYQKLLRKFLNFNNAINEVIPIIREYTHSRITTISIKPFYVTNGETNKETNKLQDHFIQRQTNEQLTRIYNFPLQDEDFFLKNYDTVQAKVVSIFEIQKELFQTIKEEFEACNVVKQPRAKRVVKGKERKIKKEVKSTLR